MHLCYERNGKRAACNYRILDARGRLLSTREARVARGVTNRRTVNQSRLRSLL